MFLKAFQRCKGCGVGYEAFDSYVVSCPLCSYANRLCSESFRITLFVLLRTHDKRALFCPDSREDPGETLSGFLLSDYEQTQITFVHADELYCTCSDNAVLSDESDLSVAKTKRFIQIQLTLIPFVNRFLSSKHVLKTIEVYFKTRSVRQLSFFQRFISNRASFVIALIFIVIVFSSV